MSCKSILRFVALSTLVALFTSPAVATDYTWNAITGGYFAFSGNWTPSGGPPGEFDSARFTAPTVYDVGFTKHEENQSFEVTAGSVTFDMFNDNTHPTPDAAFGYWLYATSGGAANITGATYPAALYVKGGYAAGEGYYSGWSRIVTSSYLDIGRDAGKTGTLDLDGAWWYSTHNTFVGKEGTGNLLIHSDAYMDNELAVIGFFPGSSGTVDVWGDWDNNSDLYVGMQGDGTLNIYGDVSTVGDTFIASAIGSTGHVTVDTFATWSNDSSLYVGGGSITTGGTATITIEDAYSEITVADDMIVHSTSTVTINEGTLNAGSLSGGGTMNWTAGTINITGGDLNIDAGMPLGNNLTIASPHELDVAGTLIIGAADIANLLALSGATITSTSGQIGGTDSGVLVANMLLNGSGTTWTMTGDLSVGGAGTLGADLSISDQAVVTNDNAFVASTVGTTAEIDISLVGTQWNNSGSAYLGGNDTTPGGSGILDLHDSASMSVGGTMKIWDDFTVIVDSGMLTVGLLDVAGSYSQTGLLDLSGTGPINALVLNGGTVAADTIDFGENPFSGYGKLLGDVIATQTITATGELTIGDINSYTAVQLSGGLDVGAHTVTVNKAGFFNVGFFTNVAGGTLNVPGGVAIPVGNSLVAFGAINGRLAAQSGSTIDAAGDLSLGDAASTAGFFSDGELFVHDHTVTIYDANQAVLGSITILGDEENPGTIVADGGAVLEFGKNIIGFGTIDTPDEQSTPFTNNGHIQGDSPQRPITLDGYVKGVGTMDNVQIAGTLSPGFSPCTLAVSDIAFAKTATLVVELGGLTAGNEFDQINVAGTATLDGTLDIRLLGDFSPALGDSFEILTFDTRNGDFIDCLGLDLGGGLSLQKSFTESSLMLTAIYDRVPGDFNEDGNVDVSDLGILATYYGTTSGATWSMGDASGDGAVDVSDLGILATWYGTTAVVVPEPGTTTVLLSGLVGLLLFRRR